MAEITPIDKLQRRLIELGCPVKAVRKIVRETTEHWEDLKRAEVASGVTEEEAAVRAAEQLGESGKLAERHVEALRAASVWGRLPVVYFGIVPLLAAVLLGVGYVSMNDGWLPAWAVSGLAKLNQPWIFIYLARGAGLFAAGLFAFITYLFCRRARNLILGWRTIWLTGGVLAAHGLLLHVEPSEERAMFLRHTVSVRESMADYQAHSHPVFSPERLDEMERHSVQQDSRLTAKEKQEKWENLRQARKHEKLSFDDPSPFSPNLQIIGLDRVEEGGEGTRFFPATLRSASQAPYEWVEVTQSHEVSCPMPLVYYAWPTLEEFSNNLSIWLNVGGPLLLAWWMARGLGRAKISVEDGDDRTAAVA